MNFHLITYGCKLNQSDSEVMKALLLKAGFKESLQKEADFIIINTCGVVEKTERKILKQAVDFKKQNKKVILTGCLPCVALSTVEGAKQGLPADAILGPKDINLIVEALKSVSKGEKFAAFKGKGFDKAKIKKSENADLKNISAVVAISEGCLGACSYCATRLARQELNSFAIKNILSEIKTKLKSGFKEIQLTSQDLAIFGLDAKNHKQDLPKLMQLIADLPQDFRVKLGMMNPGHTKKIFKSLLKELKANKFYKFLHIPLQSGSDDILKAMRRGYQADDFIKLAEQFRKKFPDSVLATDIIVGHPLETDKDFKKTAAIIKKIQPDVLHVFKFSKRKGTPDYRLKDMPDRIKKERSRILNKIFQDYNLKRNKKFLKKEFLVLIIKKNQNNFLGRTQSGRAVVLKNGKIGEFRKVKISDYRWNYLIGA